METPAMARQMINFQKTMFDNTFAMMISLQDQGEKMLDLALSRTPMVPEGSKKACTYWVDFFKKNRESYKTLVDDGFTRMQQMHQSATATAKKTTDAPAKPAAAPVKIDA